MEACEMNFRSKLFQFLLVSVLAVLTFFSPTISQAEVQPVQSKDVVIEGNHPIKHIEYLSVESDGSTKKIDKSTYDAAKVVKEANELHKQSPESITPKNSNILQTDKQAVVPNKKQENKTKQLTPAQQESVLALEYSTTFNEFTQSIDLSIKITDIIGQAPIVVLSNLSLYAGDIYDDAYYRQGYLEVDWQGSQIHPGQIAQKSFKVNSTKWWATNHNTTAGWVGSYPQTSSEQYDPTLANKKAVMYPIIYNGHSEQYMPIPKRANLPKADNPVDWDSYKRGAYIAQYIDTYGNPGWDWSEADIHHVIPRAYGGNNSFDNLFPLPRQIHQQIVNPWWSAY
ncbi:HNH endonuclease [Bacillus cereus]|uniref:HNH endonuclease signature motif containing protein n=2 Tax=Bacillus cereus group TaxID=86661 RepID=UPI003D6473D6|nr:HNH endonuclease [Bacillus cereus]